MPKTPLRAAAAIGGTADDVEAAFYEALQRGDIDALMACWADEDEVFCCLLYTSPSPRDGLLSRMPSSA